MVTNKDILKCREQIFSYSATYQVPFYGRVAAISEMIEKVSEASPAETIIISQPLGSGKTFLMNYMINNGLLGMEIAHPFLYLREIADNPSVMEQVPGDILIVDEADIKVPYKKIVRGLELLGNFLSKSGKRAILIGDNCLQNERITACLERKTLISQFESIDEKFFKGVLDMRFRHFLQEKYDLELDSIMERELVRYLVPDWMKNVNNFRSIFSILQGIAAEMKFNTEKAYFTVEKLQDCFHKNREFYFNEYQQKYFAVLKQYIKQTCPNGNNIGDGFFGG